MNHREAQDGLPELIEAELSWMPLGVDPKFAELVAHLDSCAQCADLHDRLLAQAKAEREGAIPAPYLANPGRLVAIAVIILGFAVGLVILLKPFG